MFSVTAKKSLKLKCWEGKRTSRCFLSRNRTRDRLQRSLCRINGLAVSGTPVGQTAGGVRGDLEPVFLILRGISPSPTASQSHPLISTRAPAVMSTDAPEARHV